MIIIVALIVLLIGLFIGVPIPLAFLMSSLSIVLTSGIDPIFLLPYGFSQINSVLLLTIPLFVLAGSVMNQGGIGEKLIGSIEKILPKKMKGGLGIVAAVACGLFGAISGSAGATLSCIGSIMAPRMRENGYHDGFIGSYLSSCGVLGLLIPPSMSMILYAWSGNVSVLACFLSTVIPGIILIILFSIVNVVYARKEIKTVPQRNDGAAYAAAGAPKEKSAIPALLMPIIILGTIYTGVLTPTESAALSVFYAIPVAMFYYKKMRPNELGGALVDAAKTTGVIMIMLFSVMILSRLYTMNNLPQQLLKLMMSISTNHTVLLLMVNMFLVIIGMLIDDTSAVLLSTPILLPIAVELGVSPIQFAAIIGVNTGMGNITPPTAPLLYLSGRITGAEVKDMLPHTFRLILFAWVPTLIIVTFIPDVSLFLPRLFGYV